MDNDTTATTTTTPSTADAVLADPRPQLDRALATAGAVLSDIRPEELGLPTPCGAMDVNELIAHLVAVVERIDVIGREGDIGEVPGWIPTTLEDLPARWADGAARASAAWADDDHLVRTVRVPWDTMPGRDALAIYVNELTVHSWDVARAVGRSPAWDEQVLAVSEAAVHQQLPDPVRAPTWAAVAEAIGEPFDPPFADAVEVADDAAAIDRVVAWNGRRP